MTSGKWVWVDGKRYKVPVRWRINAWFRAAFADGVALGRRKR